MCDNQLGTEGWCAIFGALRDNKDNKIETWDLSSQGIDSEIAKVLAEYLSVSTAVCSLNVSGNYIGPEGAKHFADALVVNQSITSLECAHTPNALAFSR